MKSLTEQGAENFLHFRTGDIDPPALVADFAFPFFDQLFWQQEYVRAGEAFEAGRVGCLDTLPQISRVLQRPFTLRTALRQKTGRNFIEGLNATNGTNDLAVVAPVGEQPRVHEFRIWKSLARILVRHVEQQLRRGKTQTAEAKPKKTRQQRQTTPADAAGKLYFLFHLYSSGQTDSLAIGRCVPGGEPESVERFRRQFHRQALVTKFEANRSRSGLRVNHDEHQPAIRREKRQRIVKVAAAIQFNRTAQHKMAEVLEQIKFWRIEDLAISPIDGDERILFPAPRTSKSYGASSRLVESRMLGWVIHGFSAVLETHSADSAKQLAANTTAANMLARIFMASLPH